MKLKKSNASSNIVYEGLKAEILSLRLAPGSSISETDIASKFNVSRTPVRDAVKGLSNEGLLEVKGDDQSFRMIPMVQQHVNGCIEAKFRMFFMSVK